MQYVLIARVSGKRPMQIWIKTYRILSLFNYFHANIVSHFSFLDRRQSGMMRTATPSNALSTDAIQFEKDQTSQLDGSPFSLLSAFDGRD
jgi:hypothetical protein